MITTVPVAIPPGLWDIPSRYISNKIKELLENKHLYQHLNIDINCMKDSVPDSLRGKPEEYLRKFEEISKKLWFPLNGIDPINIGPISDGNFIRFTICGIKTYCSTCKRIEPYNPVNATDFLRIRDMSSPIAHNARGPIQVFILSYLCQSCKHVPEVFTIRRDGLRLTICGRAPIEHVDAHPSIPTPVKKYLSDSIIAYQSGQTLAALFLLRTMIEQWTIISTDSHGIAANEALDRYTDMLPIDFKDRFPSLKKIYSDISADIHSATGSADLFEVSKSSIIKHFEARRLFELD